MRNRIAVRDMEIDLFDAALIQRGSNSMKNRNVGLAVTTPSCACWFSKIEEKIEAALRFPQEALKLVVPFAARLVFDRQLVELRTIIETLKEGICKCAVDRFQFGIPLRPLFLPAVWKIKVDRLSKELRGVISASIDFVRSVIAVDYLPALVQPHEIRNILLGRGRRHLVDPRQGEKREEYLIDIGGYLPDPERILRSDVDVPSFVGKSVFRPCHCNSSDGMAA